MKSRSTLFFLLFLVAFPIHSQNFHSKNIKGRIVDESGIPIAYANITLSTDPSLGTYSNAGGEFNFRFPDHRIGAIAFSCLGYETLEIPIGDISELMTLPDVVLKSKTYTLNEVVISPDTAISIVRKAVEMLHSNLPSEKNILQGFYREVIRSNRTYDRLVEAAVDVFDKGYHGKDDELQFKIREIRKSDDFRDLDWKAAILEFINPKNGLHGDFESLFDNDYIRSHNALYIELTGTPLNEQFFKSVDFSVDSVIQDIDDKILCIGFHSRYDSLPFLPYGTIYVRSKDFAILQMESAAIVNPEMTGPRPVFEIPGQQYVYRNLIKYKEYNGAMYLSFIHRQAFKFQFNWTKVDKSKNTEGFFYHELLFATNEIITEKNKVHKFRKKERVDKEIDLYDEDWTYNKKFWETYNAVNERPLEPRIKKDIERETTLDEQFKKNK